jgi:transcriptional regulator with GAF, ATPase, and Fis domain
MTTESLLPADLPQEERRVLLHLALLPPPVSLDLLLEAGGAPAVAALRVIQPLLDRGSLASTPELGPGYYHFPDGAEAGRLLAEAGAGEVRRAAGDLLAWLARARLGGPYRWLASAHVHQMSGVRPPRCQDLLDAAVFCREGGNHEAARIYLNLATEALEADPGDRDLQEAYVLATAELLADQHELMPFAEQKRALELARRLGRDLGLHGPLARLELSFGVIHSKQGDYAEANRHLDHAWSLGGRKGDQGLRLRAALAASEMLFQQGLVADAVGKYEEALGKLEDLPEDYDSLRSCARLGWFYAITGEMARGIGLIEAVADKSRPAGHPGLKTYAGLMKSLAYMEARRHEEAEALLNTLLAQPPEQLGLYIPWAANAAMAYCLYARGDLTGCYRLQERAYESSRRLGMPHQRGPWNFEYMEALEEAGLVHPDMTCRREIARLLAYPDIYMQGVALRVRARLESGRGGGGQRAEADLRRSVELLRRAGARLELARSLVDLGRLLLVAGGEEAARPLLAEAWETFSAVDEPLFPEDLRHHLLAERREDLVVRTVVEVGNTLGAVRDREELLSRIIALIMRLSRAERGGFFLLEEGSPRLAASRNLEESALGSPEFEPVARMLRQAAESRREVIAERAFLSNRAGPDRRGGGWALCGPVMLGERVLGVAYLESGLDGSRLDREDLTLLAAIGNQVAVALDSMQAYDEIARLRDRLEEENRIYLQKLEGPLHLGRLVGESPAMQEVYASVRQVAPTGSTVLILGETGVGKELVARSVHKSSRRREGPFIPVDSSLPEELFASELFGYERGAFTGAVKARPGRIELAGEGTLFLDEVQDLSPAMQSKLLRVIQEHQYTRLGASAPRQADFRLIAASNQDLAELVDRGRFRPDLFYRLNVFPIRVPPLRERQEDIPLLAQHFLEHFAAKMGKEVQGMSDANLEALCAYPWPGNVRELRHVIERGVIVCRGRLLRLPLLEEKRPAGGYAPAEFPSLRRMEKDHILEALRRCGWKVSGEDGAAGLLGLKPSTLYSKIRRLGLKKETHFSDGQVADGPAQGRAGRSGPVARPGTGPPNPPPGNRMI